jgi:hypothetical protein
LIPYELPLAGAVRLVSIALAAGAVPGGGLAPPLQEPQATRVEAGREERGEEHAFLELESARESVFVQQAIRLRLRFGFEQEFLRARMVQPFRRELDVPAQVQAPWLEGLSGAVLGEGTAPRPDDGDRERLTFALGEGVAEAVAVGERPIDGRDFVLLEAELVFLPERPGELVFAEPTLRFAYATRFRAAPFGGRVPADRRDALVRGNALVVRVQPLPEEGRPLEFTGAVGRFEVSADARPREVALGEGLELALEIAGEGNLASFGPPRLDRLAGFHLRGAIDSKERGVRRLTYDLAPQNAAVKEIPAIPFAFFDPEPPAGYRTVWTRPIPIEVLPAAPSTASREAPIAGPRSQPPEPDAPLQVRAFRGRTPVALFALALLFALSLWILLRARSRARNRLP